MIIETQEKEEIINFNNVEKIYIQEVILSTKTVYLIKCKTREEAERLGQYATEEKAKQILQDIISFYIRNENQNKVYRMPKE